MCPDDAQPPWGEYLEHFAQIGPPHDYRVYLGEQFSPGGLLPQELRGEHRGYLRAFLSNYPSSFWWSQSFHMPSLSWRSELLSAPPWCPATVVSAVNQRSAFALHGRHKHGATS